MGLNNSAAPEDFGKQILYAFGVIKIGVIWQRYSSRLRFTWTIQKWLKMLLHTQPATCMNVRLEYASGHRCHAWIWSHGWHIVMTRYTDVRDKHNGIYGHRACTKIPCGVRTYCRSILATDSTGPYPQGAVRCLGSVGLQYVQVHWKIRCLRGARSHNIYLYIFLFLLKCLDTDI